MRGAMMRNFFANLLGFVGWPCEFGDNCAYYRHSLFGKGRCWEDHRRWPLETKI